MRRLFVGCMALLLAVTAAAAWAQTSTPGYRVDAVRSPVLGDLRGKSCDEARAELLKLDYGLESCPVGKASGRYPALTINWQSLAPGTPASRSSTGPTCTMDTTWRPSARRSGTSTRTRPVID